MHPQRDAESDRTSGASSEELQPSAAALQTTTEHVVLTPQQLQDIIGTTRLRQCMDEHMPGFVCGMVKSMTAGFQEQIGGIANAQAASDAKLDRFGMAVSELSERLRASGALAQQQEAANISPSCARP